MQRRLGFDLEIPDDFGHWLAGFVAGEGCFYAKVQHGHNGTHLTARLTIMLRDDDVNILRMIQKTLGAGKIYILPKRRRAELHIDRKSDLYHIIVPLFERYPLRARKQQDFNAWKEFISFAISYDGKHKGSRSMSKAVLLEAQRLANHLREARRYIRPAEAEEVVNR